MIKKVLDFFFGWELVYSTQRIEDYSKVKGKLMNAGVKSKTKFIRHGSQRQSGFGNLVTYEVYVRKEDVHHANNAIHYNT